MRAFWLVPLAACGTGATGSVTGTFHGKHLAIVDTVSAVAQPEFGNPGAQIVMATSGDLCTDLVQYDLRKNSARLTLWLGTSTGSVPDRPGTFRIGAKGGMNGAGASIEAFDGSCDETGSLATSGTITLSAIVGDSFAGYFDVTMDTGDHLTGAFAPTPCPDMGLWAPGHQPTCM